MEKALKETNTSMVVVKENVVDINFQHDKDDNYLVRFLFVLLWL
jgi:hypothetical protein